MPFKKSDYPANWPAIRAAVLKRDKNCCRFCGIANGSLRARPTGSKKAGLTKIVLTTAHIFDMSPQNCDLSNLAALCQRCHNRHDSRHRAQNRAATLLRKRQLKALDQERIIYL